MTAMDGAIHQQTSKWHHTVRIEPSNIEKKRLNQQRRASLRWPYPNLMSKHRRGC